MKYIVTLGLLALFCCTGSAALAENMYQVSLLRAAPGQLPSLIERVLEHKVGLKGELIVMRHSQGDHWDLMLLQPANGKLPRPTSYQQKVDFQLDFLANSNSNWRHIQSRADQSGLFHIEMFHAANGKYAQLLKQRQMENNYLEATQRKANLIFETLFGSDVDLFTLGFYSDMQAFAAEPDLPGDVFEKAAVDAGFESRSDIGFYLRRFLVSHQDTLATHVK